MTESYQDNKFLTFVDTAFFLEFGFLNSETILKKRDCKREIMDLLDKPTLPYLKAYEEFKRILLNKGISQDNIKKVFSNYLLV